MEESRKPFEHVARVNEGVEGECDCHEDHPDDDDDKGGLGPEKITAVDAGLSKELVVVLALGLRFAKEKVTTLP